MKRLGFILTLFTLGLFGFLVRPTSALTIQSYSRTPSGSPITAQSFQISGSGGSSPCVTNWHFAISDDNAEDLVSPDYSCNSGSHTWSTPTLTVSTQYIRAYDSVFNSGGLLETFTTTDPITPAQASLNQLSNTAKLTGTSARDAFAGIFISSALVIILGVVGAKWIFNKVQKSAFNEFGGRAGTSEGYHHGDILNADMSLSSMDYIDDGDGTGVASDNRTIHRDEFNNWKFD